MAQADLARLIGSTRRMVIYWEQGDYSMKNAREEIDEVLTRYEEKQERDELTKIEKLNLLLDYQGKKMKIRPYADGTRVIVYTYGAKYHEQFDVDDPEGFVSRRLEEEKEKLHDVLSRVEEAGTC